MARIKHSMTKDDYEKATSGKGAVLKPGVYRVKLIDFKDASPEGKNPRWEVIYEVSHGEGKGTRLYDYLTHGDNAKFKKDQFFTALGLVTVSGGKVKVADFDPDRLAKYPEMLARVINETYEEEQRHKLASVLPLDEDADDEDAESDEDEDEDGEEEEEDEDEDAEDEDPDFDSMSISELREWADENEVEIPAKVKGVTKVRAFLVDKWEEMAVSEDEDEDEDETETEEEPEEEEETEEVDLATLKLPALRALADENEIDHSGMNAKALREALLEALGGEDDEDEEEEDEDEVDYSTWSLGDIKSELKDRGIKPVGSKIQLIAKLKKSDESDPV